MKSLRLKALVFLLAITISASGCEIWDPIFRPNHNEHHKGDHDRDHKGEHGHKGDRDPDSRDDH
ncbi:MAG: hypothetical protein JST19_04080 [Bacteroidetes bacterium]|nr:hypothetical protein [Bacteroidota bacterium]